jgi:UDPglucose 6-dehydrogenase
VRTIRRLYASVTAPIIEMPAADAVLTKLGSNLFLATKISFANELAALCEAFGGDVGSVVGAMSYDPRIGGSFLRAGIGFGGSCLPHQVTMTIRSGRQADLDLPLLKAVDHINHDQRRVFVERIRTGLERPLGVARVALLGLTFKPGTDDLRDAPALTIAAGLLAAGAQVVAYDPMPSARARAVELLPGMETVDSALDAARGADAIGLVTEWSEFRQLDWSAMRTVARGDLVIDGRNALDPGVVTAAGFRYAGFGRRVETTVAAPAPVVAIRVEEEAIAREPAIGIGPAIAALD